MNPTLASIALGGLAALDATPVGQTLVSQPLVTATVLGFLWGDVRLGLEVGVVLQILAASTLPVGARTPEDYATGGVAGATTALALGQMGPFQTQREAAALVGAFVGLLAAATGVGLLKWQRRRNEGLSRWSEQATRDGDERALGRAHAAAVALAFGLAVAFCAAWISLGTLAGHWLVERHSIPLAKAWLLLRPLWLGYGFAQLLHAFVQRRLTRAGVFGAAMLGAWLTLVVGTP